MFVIFRETNIHFAGFCFSKTRIIVNVKLLEILIGIFTFNKLIWMKIILLLVSYVVISLCIKNESTYPLFKLCVCACVRLFVRVCRFAGVSRELWLHTDRCWVCGGRPAGCSYLLSKCDLAVSVSSDCHDFSELVMKMSSPFRHKSSWNHQHEKINCSIICSE